MFGCLFCAQITQVRVQCVAFPLLLSKLRRPYCRYGTPIDMASYVSASLFDTPDAEAERAVVKTVMKDVEAQLSEMTINAPDWYVFFSLVNSSLKMVQGKHYMRHEWREICSMAASEMSS